MSSSFFFINGCGAGIGKEMVQRGNKHESYSNGEWGQRAGRGYRTTTTRAEEDDSLQSQSHRKQSRPPARRLPSSAFIQPALRIGD